MCQFKINPISPAVGQQRRYDDELNLPNDIAWSDGISSSGMIISYRYRRFTHARWVHPDSSTVVDARIRSPEGPSVDSDSAEEHRPSSCRG